MKIKSNLTATVVILLLSFTSCQKESSVPPILDKNNEVQNTLDISPTQYLTAEQTCENLSNDPNLEILVDLLSSNNFVFNSILENSTNINNWNNLKSFIEGQNPEYVVTQTDLENYVGNESIGFSSYISDVSNILNTLVYTHLSHLDDIEKLESFKCAILGERANSDLLNNSKTDCCTAAKNAYDLCIKHAKQDGTVVFLGFALTGIAAALNGGGGGAVGAGVMTGVILGGITYSNEANQCQDIYDLTISTCNPKCD